MSFERSPRKIGLFSFYLSMGASFVLQKLAFSLDLSGFPTISHVDRPRLDSTRVFDIYSEWVHFAQAQSTTINCTSTLIFIVRCRRFRRESGVRSCFRFVFISDFWSLSLYGKPHFLSILFMYFYQIFFSFSSLNNCYTVFSSYI